MVWIQYIFEEEAQAILGTKMSPEGIPRRRAHSVKLLWVGVVQLVQGMTSPWRFDRAVMESSDATLDSLAAASLGVSHQCTGGQTMHVVGTQSAPGRAALGGARSRACGESSFIPARECL